MAKKQKLQEEAKGLKGYDEKMTIPQLEALIADSKNPVEEVQVSEDQTDELGEPLVAAAEDVSDVEVKGEEVVTSKPAFEPEISTNTDESNETVTPPNDETKTPKEENAVEEVEEENLDHIDLSPFDVDDIDRIVSRYRNGKFGAAQDLKKVIASCFKGE